MKFNRMELIQRAEAEIQKRKDEAVEIDAKAAEQAISDRQEWLDTKGPAYVLFANRVKDKIRKGRPITQEDIPEEIRGRYERITVWSDPAKHGPTQPRVYSLERLVSILQAITDDEVTSSGLAAVGYRDLHQLFA